MKTLTKMAAMLALVAVLGTGCNKDDDGGSNTTPTPTATLYTRLGGINAISAVTDQFLANVANDNRINSRFAATVANASRLQLLRNNLIDQICAGAGGPCQYKGKTMMAAHQGMNITDAEFTALVEDLVASLNQFSVPDKEKNELLAILGPMKTDIVGK